MADIRAEKVNLRKKLRKQAAALDADYLAFSDAAIASFLYDLDLWKKASRVFTYVSVGTEPDTRGILAAALAAGKEVSAPATLGAGAMEARALPSETALQAGRFGLLEPCAGAPQMLPEAIVLVIAPCVAADAEGYRLGNGGGYYDRYLARVRCPVVCLCRGRLLQKRVPREAFDVPVDAVITEDEVYFTRKFRDE